MSTVNCLRCGRQFVPRLTPPEPLCPRCADKAAYLPPHPTWLNRDYLDRICVDPNAVTKRTRDLVRGA